jgi:preprotein translocase subunit SecE
MNEDLKAPEAGAADKAKATVAILLVIAGIAGYYVLAAQPAWQRWLAMAGGLVLAVVVFGWSQYGRSVWQYAMDSRIELRKIVWPNREETGKMTAVVFIFVVIAAVFFWILDLGLAWATRALTGQGG